MATCWRLPVPGHVCSASSTLARCCCVQVLHGGENLLDKVEALKARSAATKAELEVAARQKEEQQRRLEQLQLERLDLNTQYSTLGVSDTTGGMSSWNLWPTDRGSAASHHAQCPLQAWRFGLHTKHQHVNMLIRRRR